MFNVYLLSFLSAMMLAQGARGAESGGTLHDSRDKVLWHIWTSLGHVGCPQKDLILYIIIFLALIHQVWQYRNYINLYGQIDVNMRHQFDAYS